MRFLTSLASSSSLLAASLLPSDRTALLFLLPPAFSAAKSYGSGSRPSGGSSASRPSPPSPSYSSPNTNNRPSNTSSGNNNQPSAVYNPMRNPTRPSFSSPTGPVPATSRNAYNPSPAYKPLNPTGAPATRSGGGGYGTLAKQVFVAAAVGSATVIAVNLAAGYFLYGGRHSGPYCRGNDQDRFGSGNCPRGTSSQNHQCNTNIPLCAIPALVRSKWNLGQDAPPKVDVKFDKSFCSMAALPAVVTASNTTAAANVTAATTNATADGVEGQSGLDTCVRRIVAAGGCDAQNPAGQFLYDEDTQACGCCSSVQVTTLADESFASAIYTYRAADDLTVAPLHCISGSTMYYPDAAGGPDVAHACECGTCTTCGAGGARYLDWSGPFVVPDAVGDVTFADAAKTKPEYDPVDTCICADSSAGTCESDFAVTASGAGARSPNSLIVVSSAVLLLLHSFRRN